ncbi:GspH/FimT family pseudopilin [Mangrovitalea sediminis]|uniref:GspH/FimT family pseudopilin n=1 Tax=Mangrovitalea sediminis TaxID=1982043 RepID=UPI0013040E33|nr:GspH/FimT family pseudopilin [Mangrovitalea sediminis]
MPPRCGQTGLTLIELLTAIAVIAILTVSATTFGSLLEQHRAIAVESHLKTLIYTARSEAIMRGTRVVICPSQDRQHCDAQWHRHILVFTDRNHNRKLDATEKSIRYVALTNTQETLTYNRTLLAFSAMGTAFGTNGTFTYCPGDGNPRHIAMVVVSVLGRTRLARDITGDGVVDKSQGKPGHCPGLPGH